MDMVHEAISFEKASRRIVLSSNTKNSVKEKAKISWIPHLESSCLNHINKTSIWEKQVQGYFDLTSA